MIAHIRMFKSWLIQLAALTLNYTVNLLKYKLLKYTVVFMIDDHFIAAEVL